MSIRTLIGVFIVVLGLLSRNVLSYAWTKPSFRLQTTNQISECRNYNARYTTVMMAGGGFAKPKPVEPEKKNKRKSQVEDIFTSASPCPCGSTASFGECCSQVHQSLSSSTLQSPEKVLRGRYTAYKLAIPDYIIKTTHPSNSEYEKFMIDSRASSKGGDVRWAKDIKQTSRDFQLMGLEMVGTTMESPTKSIVCFRTLFRDLSDGAIYAEEEKSTFLLAGEPKQWLFADSDTYEPEEAIAKKMVDEWPLRPENKKYMDGTSGDDSEDAAAEDDKGTEGFGSGVVKSTSRENSKKNIQRIASGGLGRQSQIIPLGKGRGP